MDGLECSEIRLSCLERTARIDAEFYKKENLYIDAELKKTDFHPITDYFSVSDGNHMSISDSFCSEGIPYYRGQDIYHVFIEEASPICINKKTYEHPHMHRSHLKAGDVLMSIVGAIIGNSAIVSTDNDATCSCKLSILRSKNTGIIPEALLVYIKSLYGQNQIQKFKRGAAQTGLLLEDFDQLFIPKFGEEFQQAVKKIVDLSHEFVLAASEIYRDVEKTLGDTIWDDASEPESLSSSIKNYSDSFLISGRLDAEYYQPKYDAFLNVLNRFETTSIPAEYHVIKNSGTNYADGISDVGVIKTKQLNNSGIDTESIESYFSAKTCVENKSTFLKSGDVVFASMGVGSLGKVSIFSNDGEKKFVTDSTLRIYRAKPTAKVRPEVLCVFLQSKLGQELIYRYVVGSTGIINIYDNDIAKIPIPIFDDSIQEHIAVKVQESFSLCKQSKQLLEYAKQAVEKAIEQGEDVALEWLKDKIPAEV